MTPEPYIIAEIASAHEGDAEFALKLFRLAARTGADAVKFQILRRDALMSRFHPRYQSFGELEISPDLWPGLLAEAAKEDVDLIVEAFDEPSLDLAEQSGVVDAYKVPTSDVGNLDFLSRVAATGRRVYLGVGGATHAEVANAVRHLDGRVRDLVLLHGFQSYPTRLEDCHLSRLPALAAEFGRPVGYADHVDGEDRELARIVPAMALAAGASVIEKHFTDDRSRKGRDHYSSLNPDEFADFVTLIRRLSAGMGRPELVLSEAEITYRHQMKRQAVAARPLAAGEAVGPRDIIFRRTNRDGLSMEAMAGLYGQRLKTAKETEEPIGGEDFQ